MSALTGTRAKKHKQRIHHRGERGEREREEDKEEEREGGRKGVQPHKQDTLLAEVYIGLILLEAIL